MKKFRFYKESTQRWYVDLPEWTGSQADLEMVCGADTMLEYMAEGNDEVNLYLSVDPFENSDTLEYVRNATELENGAFYIMPMYKGIQLNLEVWLCDVTLWVFNEFPKTIYLSVS